MTRKIKTLLVGASALALTACADGTQFGEGFHEEAGAFLDEGGFGNPTMTNMMAQMCRGKAKGYIVPDPIVSLDPKSAAGAPVYRTGRVMCSGHLNGKYANVIWGEYVGSGRATSGLGGGGLAAIEGAAGGS